MFRNFHSPSRVSVIMLATVCLHSNQRSSASLTFPQGKDKYGCPSAPRKERPHRSIGEENLSVPLRLFPENSGRSTLYPRRRLPTTVSDNTDPFHHTNMHI